MYSVQILNWNCATTPISQPSYKYWEFNLLLKIRHVSKKKIIFVSKISPFLISIYTTKQENPLFKSNLCPPPKLNFTNANPIVKIVVTFLTETANILAAAIEVLCHFSNVLIPLVLKTKPIISPLTLNNPSNFDLGTEKLIFLIVKFLKNRNCLWFGWTCLQLGSDVLWAFIASFLG